MSLAHERVRAFLDLRAERDELFANRRDDVIASVALEPDSRIALVTTADLRTLVLQAEALHHQAPQAAQAIEVGPS